MEYLQLQLDSKSEKVCEINKKISISEIDFDNLSYNELKQIYEEIEVLLQIHELKENRMKNIRESIKKEKSELKKSLIEDVEKERQKMLSTIEKEKTKILQKYADEIKNDSAEVDYDNDDVIDSEEEGDAVIYNKKTPKGRITKRTTSTRRKTKK
jgi:activator of HSP90 ATPase